MEDIRWISFKPDARRVEDLRFDVAHQHYVQHAVVCDKDVWRRLLHVPAAPHFAAVEPREEALRVGSGYAGCNNIEPLEFGPQLCLRTVPVGTARDRCPARVAP